MVYNMEFGGIRVNIYNFLFTPEALESVLFDNERGKVPMFRGKMVIEPLKYLPLG